jgi:deoxyribodipyrimidine photolyase-related protein
MNALYWDFFARHESRLAANPRIGMSYVTLRKMSPSDRTAIHDQAQYTLSKMDHL